MQTKTFCWHTFTVYQRILVDYKDPCHIFWSLKFLRYKFELTRQPGPASTAVVQYWWLEHSVSLRKVRQIISAMGTNIRRGLRENSRQHRWENVVQEVTLRMLILNIITFVFQDDVNFSREHVKKRQIRLNTTRLNMLQVFGGQMLCIHSLFGALWRFS